jgi:hypothetical protein
MKTTAYTYSNQNPILCRFPLKPCSSIGEEVMRRAEPGAAAEAEKQQASRVAGAAGRRACKCVAAGLK